MSLMVGCFGNNAQNTSAVAGNSTEAVSKENKDASSEAAEILVKNGFKDVTNAEGVKQYEYNLVK